MKLSFVIPAKDEEGSVEELYREISREAGKITKQFEIIFIDDGSKDKTFEILKELSQKDKNVKVVKFRGNWGKAAAFQTGFSLATGDIIFTMDSDLQDNPSEIPNFIAKLEDGYDLVSGWKKERHDPWHKVIPSRVLNWLTGKFTGVWLHDINCGFKAYRREVVENLNLYGELFRFIPVFAAKQNYRVTEIPVEHKERKFGKSKFGFERNIKGLLDLITIIFLTGYVRRPGHFFGTLGLASFFSGFLIGIYITYLRVSAGNIQGRSPLLFLGILLMVIGIQLLTTGLLAEMLLFSRQKQDYRSAIDKELGFK
ncbi:MAG: glycosyl transferase family 2 [Candidatus Blackburnbacteria bacterium RIFCSPLOWO2_01_FULL_41_27]|uniref:Glycosyl transferase family 2 n=2 Tax=Candidatus Blackburniibacteriota TaxID=1817898 RepID=A0A1G1VC72_9BACT|nr:MAG: glycosyl transferase family 2 [Candidatus Blackburnbacteria bacterium RIFCSPHIGHO2_12_FULL_41_13b]OGY15059.1 MAG: glycosyl transferase family 2 [Candidatus Blackburnbacteria bacterium RIFCSPLOWO2_01_FULL_41_27]